MPNEALIALLLVLVTPLGVDSLEKAEDIEKTTYKRQTQLLLHSSGKLVVMIVPEEEYRYWNLTEPRQGRQHNQAYEIMAQRVYSGFQDAFDFIFLVMNNETHPDGVVAGQLHQAKTEIRGLGQRSFDETDRNGSQGRLQAVVRLTKRTGLVSGPALHELLHNWGNYVIETVDRSHWAFASVGGQLGGWSRNTLEHIGGSNYRASVGGRPSFGIIANGGNSVPYAPLELYLMGLIPPEEVPPVQVAINAEWVDRQVGTFNAEEIETTTIEQIIKEHGQRVPSYEDSQKEFRAIVVLVSPEFPESVEIEQVIRSVDEFSYQGEDADPSRYNFWEATGGRASITMDGLSRLKRVEKSH